MKPHLCRVYSFFPEFHDVKTEISMSCKELFDKQCLVEQYRKGGNTRSSCLHKFFKIGVLKNFTNFTGKRQR